MPLDACVRFLAILWELLPSGVRVWMGVALAIVWVSGLILHLPWSTECAGTAWLRRLLSSYLWLLLRVVCIFVLLYHTGTAVHKSRKGAALLRAGILYASAWDRASDGHVIFVVSGLSVVAIISEFQWYWKVCLVFLALWFNVLWGQR